MTKIVNVYFVYELHAWLGNPTNNFKFKNSLFGATNIVKNSGKEKYVYNGYGIAFDSAGSWSFNKDFARDVRMFCVYNSSLSLRKNNFLILGEGPTYGINGSFAAPEKIIYINFNKVNPKFCLSLSFSWSLATKYVFKWWGMHR